jgi:UrcA family protein
MTSSIQRTLRASILGASIVSIAALGLGAPALAQSADAGAPRSVAVRYADLDLASRAGAAEVFARIRSAARAVCGEADIRLLERQAQAARCRSETTASAVEALHAPLVASMAGQGDIGVILAAR